MKVLLPKGTQTVTALGERKHHRFNEPSMNHRIKMGMRKGGLGRTTAEEVELSVMFKELKL